MSERLSHWLTFGMSAFDTPGFHDTSRWMTSAAPVPRAYVEPSPPYSAWRGLQTPVLRWRSRRSRETWVLTPPLPIPGRIDVANWGIQLQARALERTLEAEWGRDWRRTTLVYLTNWSYAVEPLVSSLAPEYLVLDLVDDVLSFPYRLPRQRVLERWRRISRRASAVIAVSPALQAWSEAHLGRPAHLLPNGVDAGHFAAHAELPNLPSATCGGIRVGFAGTLNHWIDYPALLSLMEQLPDTELYLMGCRGHIGDPELEDALHSLQAHPRVHVLGPVPYERLPAYLHAMDILILPRIPSPASAASNPLKLGEYLAVGKPPVVSGVPVPPPLGGLVYEAAPNTGLAEAVRRAWAEVKGEAPSRRAERQAFARQHTWQARVQEVVALAETGGSHPPMLPRVSTGRVTTGSIGLSQGISV
ncbi:glycosyltransferase [Alicyclobacillus macrosporangiidus]|uniref:Glycosyl transferases group 1 n=1 Tax=Alicyclobacillus macrosporangiidus TaxID=392015 RepID=A0A1I7JBL5_9BACL|nr:glycosyltransferase [Alicyclobacillus macrosporangiidus]SFU82552.1 Glycosyl transferases group 1 [Alicyclobacillus macrosporangiidus]